MPARCDLSLFGFVNMEICCRGRLFLGRWNNRVGVLQLGRGVTTVHDVTSMDDFSEFALDIWSWPIYGRVPEQVPRVTEHPLTSALVVLKGGWTEHANQKRRATRDADSGATVTMATSQLACNSSVTIPDLTCERWPWRHLSSDHCSA